MSSVRYDGKQPAGGSISPLRLLFGTVAIVLLVALAALGGGEPSRDGILVEKGGSAVASDQGASNAPVYDGRGKWSGY